MILYFRSKTGGELYLKGFPRFGWPDTRVWSLWGLMETDTEIARPL